MWMFIGFIVTLLLAAYGGKRYQRQIKYYYGRYAYKFKRIQKRPETPPAVIDGGNQKCHTVCL